MLRMTCVTALGLVLLSGCSSSPDENEIIAANRGAQALYDDAKQSLEVGNFGAAANILSQLDSRYPFGPLSLCLLQNGEDRANVGNN